MSALRGVLWRFRGATRRWFQSLLGVPALGVLAGVALALGTAAASRWLDGRSVPDVATVTIARDVLPAIGGATLTLAGFVLTITTLSLQFGASTYAPRLVEQLRREPLLRHTLGGALGTFTYAIVVLLVVREAHPVAATLASVLALLGATGTVLLFIGLLDRLTAMLRPGRTMTRLTRQAFRVMESAYPDRDRAVPETGPDGLPDLEVVDWSCLPATGVVWREAGYGSLIDVDRAALVSLANECDLHVRMLVTVGTFLGSREAIAVLTDRSTGEPVDADDDKAARVLGALSVGDERSADADPSFPLRFLADIAVRALSPGINDPTTAGQAIDHIEQVLGKAADRQLGAVSLKHEDVEVATLPAPGWVALLDSAWTEIWHFGTDPQTRRALRAALTRLGARVPAERRADVDRLLQRLEDTPV